MTFARLGVETYGNLDCLFLNLKHTYEHALRMTCTKLIHQQRQNFRLWHRLVKIELRQG